MMKNLVKFLLIFVSVIFSSKIVNASGYAVYTHGAKELGMLNAVVAHSEGPASNFYNPALINDLEGTQFEIGTTIIYPSREFSDATGNTTDGKTTVFFPSTFFLSHKLNDSFSLGFGVYSPFGLGTKWPRNWEGRYITTEGQLTTFNFNPNIAWKIFDNLSLAGGIDYLYGDAILKRKIDLASLIPFPGYPDGSQKFDGNGDGWGYNFGFNLNVTDKFTFGLSYRSQIDLDLEGDVSFSGTDFPGSPFNSTGGNVELGLPAQVSFGFSYQLNEKILIELSGRWENWSVFDSLVYKFNEDLIPPLVGRILIENKDWEDAWGEMIGFRYTINPTSIISVGYLHEGNPIPDGTFEPLIPDTDKNMFSVGFQKIIGKYNIALTYIYAVYDDRKKNNLVGVETGSMANTANGEYSQDSHFLSAALKVNF